MLMLALLATSTMINATYASDDSDTESADSLFDIHGRRVSPSELLGAAKGNDSLVHELDSKAGFLSSGADIRATETYEAFAEPVRAATLTLAGALPKEVMVVPAKEGLFTFTLASHHELMTGLFIGKEAKGSLGYVFLSYEEVKNLSLMLPYSEDYIKHIIESQKGDNDSDDIIIMRKAITNQLYPRTPLIEVVDRLDLKNYGFNLRGTDEQMADEIVSHVEDLNGRLASAEQYNEKYWTTLSELRTVKEDLAAAEKAKAQAAEEFTTRFQAQETAYKAELEAVRQLMRINEQAHQERVSKLVSDLAILDREKTSAKDTLTACIEENASLTARLETAEQQRTTATARAQELTEELTTTRASLELARQQRAALKDWIVKFRDTASALVG
jgi:hypothetical protein